MYSLSLYFPDGDFLSNKELLESLKELPPDKQLSGYDYQNRLDLLSYDSYGNVELWWVLGIYNDIINPIDFDIQVLYVPLLSDVESVLNKFNS